MPAALQPCKRLRLCCRHHSMCTVNCHAATDIKSRVITLLLANCNGYKPASSAARGALLCGCRPGHLKKVEVRPIVYREGRREGGYITCSRK